MNPAISEWTWTLFVLLLRTGVISTVILLAVFVVIRCKRGVSAAVRHRIWFAAVMGCCAVPSVMAFVPVRTFSVSSPPSVTSSPADEKSIGENRASVKVVTVGDSISESLSSPVEIESPTPRQPEPGDAEHFLRETASVAVPTSRPSPKSQDPDTAPAASDEEVLSESEGTSLRAWLLSNQYPTWFVAGWLLVAVALIWQILRATAATRKMVRLSVPISEPGALTLLNEVCSEMGVRAPVELRRSRSIEVPMITGLAKPIILLPGDAMDWPKERLVVVLRHELSHIVRRDLLSQLLADCGTAIWWYQPLLWYASRRLRVEREFACDDLVLQTGTAPCDYADELLAVASKAVLQPRRSSVAVSMAGRSTVEHRIRSILDPKTNRCGLSRFGTSLLVLTGAMLVLIATSLTPNFSITADDTPATNAASAKQSPSAPEESSTEAVAAGESKTKKPQENKETAQSTEKISGQVVDVSGQPVSGAEVSLNIYGQDPRKATTDAEGRFRFDGAAKLGNAIRLEARADEGRRLGFLKLYRDNPKEGFQEAKLTLEPTKEALIRVLDGQGRPIKDAISGIIAGYNDAGSARSNTDGTAKVLVPRSLEIQHVYAMKEGVGFDYKSFTVPRDRLNDRNYVKPAFPAGGVTLTLDGVKPLNVKLLTTDGQPIPNILVYPWLLEKAGETEDLNLSYLVAGKMVGAWTDEDGIASFPWIPHWQKKQITIWPKSDKFVNQRGMYDPTTGNGTLEMRLERLVPLRGKVLLPDGRGAGGITIDIAGEGYGFDDFRTTVTSAEDGTFEALAAPNKVYLLVVKAEKWAAEPLTGFALWPNKPIENLEFKLRPATKIHGQVTIGSDKKPVPDLLIQSYQFGADAHNLKGVTLPNPENSNSWVQPITVHSTRTDAEGRYELFVGPGQFDIRGPNQNKVQKFEIKDEAEKTFDFHMPRPEKGILKGLVVAGDPPKPVAGAKVYGIVRWELAGLDLNAVTDEEGSFEIERELHLTSMHVQSADGKLGALLEVDADAMEVKIPLKPQASASGRLVDSTTGEPLVDRELTYGVLVYSTEKNDGPFRISFGGKTTTDANGRFFLEHLVPGGDYHIDVTIEKSRRWKTVGKVQPQDAKAIDLGNLKLKPDVEYKPPTIGDRITKAFDQEKTPIERYESALSDIKLSRQRIMLLFANPTGDAVKQFMTLRYEDDDVRGAFDEFRLMAVNSAPSHQESAKRLLEKFQQNLDEETSKFLLLIVDEDGRRIDLRSASDLTTVTAIDQKKVLAFLQKNTQAPLDARTLLKEALAQAKRESKQVIVQETATWCGPCWLLSRFLDKHRELWERDYLWVKIDHRWTGTKDLMAELRDGAEGGIPWWAILDADGKKLVTSNLPDGENIGFPSSPEGIKHFRVMLQQSAQHMTAEQIDALAGHLESKH